MTKKKEPPKTDLWMPLWIGDYLADTMSLSTAQHGAYLLLLMAYWRNRGPLKDDDDDLRGIAKADAADWPALRTKVLERFFTACPGVDADVTSLVTSDVTTLVWRHKRADEEMLLAQINKEAQQARTSKATAARLEKLNAGAGLPDSGDSSGGSEPPADDPRNVPRNVGRNVERNVPPGDLVTLSPSPSPSPPPTEVRDSVAKATGAAKATPPGPAMAAAPRPPKTPVAVPPAPTGVKAKPPATPEDLRKQRIWRAAKSFFEGQDMPAKQSGAYLGRLAADYGFPVFAEAVERLVVERPAEGQSWFVATLQTIAGERRARTGSNKQVQLEAGNDAAVEAWLKEKGLSNA